jgi:uncharacterized protein (TIGR00251 family)
VFTLSAMLREDSEGVVLTVRVKPRARRNAVVGARGDALVLEVTAPPEHNKANDAVIALLADVLDVAKSRIEILSGQSSREKRVRIVGLTAQEFQERLQARAHPL